MVLLDDIACKEVEGSEEDCEGVTAAKQELEHAGCGISPCSLLLTKLSAYADLLCLKMLHVGSVLLM